MISAPVGSGWTEDCAYPDPARSIEGSFIIKGLERKNHYLVFDELAGCGIETLWEPDTKVLKAENQDCVLKPESQLTGLGISKRTYDIFEIEFRTNTWRATQRSYSAHGRQKYSCAVVEGVMRKLDR